MRRKLDCGEKKEHSSLMSDNSAFFVRRRAKLVRKFSKIKRTNKDDNILKSNGSAMELLSVAERSELLQDYSIIECTPQL